MANQLKMAQVQAILALHAHGWSDRRIARELGVHRETVGRYVQAPGVSEAKPANAPSGSESVLGAEEGSKPAIAPPGSDGASPGPGGRERGPISAALAWREVIVQKLEQGLNARRIYQDLISPDHGYAGSYYSVRRLIRKLTAASPLPVRRMECAPGAEAQVDFGRGAPIVGPDGKRKTSWVFRIVLSYSRKGYSEAVAQQTTDGFLRCLENAFAHFGGAPQTLVIDNLRAAVTRADWFDPELCPKVRSFAGHYGIAVLPTRPRTPRHKGKVESGVKYVKNNALKGMKFASLADQNHHLLDWESTVADTRIHGTTRQQVIKLFTQIERAALLPLPPSRFELFHESPRTVHRDGHVMVKGAHYSVPPEYLGQQLWARWDGRTVRLFDQKMRPIALHAQRPPGAFSTIDAHLHPHKISNIERGADWLLNQADRIGPRAKEWAESMLQNRGIEGVRVLMGLVSLSGKHPRHQIEQACQVALGHGAYHLRSLRQLIRHQDDQPIQQNFDFVQRHPIIRDLEDYAHFVRAALTQPPNPLPGSV
jgi:transposase